MSTGAELRERLTVANERLADALLMFESEEARLSHLADVIDPLAGALRAIDARASDPGDFASMMARPRDDAESDRPGGLGRTTLYEEAAA